jgi:hypothetical protein
MTHKTGTHKTGTMRKLRGLLGLAAAEAFLIAAILNGGEGEWFRMLCDLVGIGVAGYIVTLTPAQRRILTVTRQDEVADALTT